MNTLPFTRFEKACNNDRDKVFAFLGSRLIQIKFTRYNVLGDRPSKDGVLNFLEAEFVNRPKSAKDKPFPDAWCQMIHFMLIAVDCTKGEPEVISPFPPGSYDKMERYGHLYNLLHAIHYDHHKQGRRHFGDILTIKKLPIKTGPISRKKEDNVAVPNHPLDPLDASVRTLDNLISQKATEGEIRRAFMAVEACSKDLRNSSHFIEG